MSRSQQIREWLAKQDGPQKPGDIAAGIGKPRSKLVAHTIKQMRKDGYLVRSKGDTCWLYSLGKPANQIQRFTPEERRERKNRQERERAHAQGRRTWAEHLAHLDLMKQQRAVDRAVAAEKRKKGRDKPVHDARHRTRPVPVIVHSSPITVAKKPEVETVEQWMARTGKKPQVLRVGEVSKPLRISANFNNWERKAA